MVATVVLALTAALVTSPATPPALASSVGDTVLVDGREEDQLPFFSPQSIDLGADGRIYATTGEGIARFTPAGAFDGFHADPDAIGVGVDAGGRMYSAASRFGTASLRAHDGQFQQRWEVGAPQVPLGSPRGVAAGPDGPVYVTDSLGGRVHRFDLYGGHLGRSPADTGLRWPLNASVTADGTVWVADAGEHLVVELDADGALRRTVGGSRGTAPGQFNSPSGAATDAAGNLYVADRNNHRVEIFDAGGRHALSIGGPWPGEGLGEFDRPRDLAVAGDGTVYVADAGNRRIVRLAPRDLLDAPRPGDPADPDAPGAPEEPDEPEGPGEPEEPRDPVSTTRYAGPDRYATAVELSRGEFPAGADLVVLATGQTFPDALAGSVLAAAEDAPILLVARDGVPAVVAEELERLAPSRVILLGGPSAVGDGVLADLDELDTDVLRLSGGDRFETAVRVSAHLTGHGDAAEDVGSPTRVLLANGRGFADALAGGPAAAVDRQPILLTEAEALPEVTLAELRRLDPDEVVLLGGTGMISEQLRRELDAAGGWQVGRWSGVDRYATAGHIAEEAFAEGASTVYLSTGTAFADGLAAGAVAGAASAPLLLSPPDRLPEIVARQLLRLDPRRVVILGGDTAVSSFVEEDVERVLEEPRSPS